MNVCAWCQQPIAPSRAAAPVATAPAVSHGICPSCLSAQMAQLDRAPAPIAALR